MCNKNYKQKHIMGIAVIKIRLQGIIGCITQYTSEPTIKNIRKSLEKALVDNDLDIILFTCKEIDKWYETTISEILSNQFVSNKAVHQNNCSLIKQIIAEIEQHKFEYSEILTKSKTREEKLLTVNALIHLLNRFHLVSMQLRDRYSRRETLDVSDEYDVQDLLHSLLHIYYDDIRPEEWTPSYAGTSSRQDFLLKNEKIVIETKKQEKV